MDDFLRKILYNGRRYETAKEKRMAYVHKNQEALLGSDKGGGMDMTTKLRATRKIQEWNGWADSTDQIEIADRKGKKKHGNVF